jgi:hypothetical protein
MASDALMTTMTSVPSAQPELPTASTVTAATTVIPATSTVTSAVAWPWVMLTTLPGSLNPSSRCSSPRRAVAGIERGGDCGRVAAVEAVTPAQPFEEMLAKEVLQAP